MSSAHMLMKNRIYFKLHVRHKGDNASFYKVLNALLSIHRDAANVKIHTRHMSPERQPQKCSMIEKYLKFPLCSLFLCCSSPQKKKVLIVPKKKYHMDPSEPFDFHGMKPNASLCLVRGKDSPSPPA